MVSFSLLLDEAWGFFGSPEWSHFPHSYSPASRSHDFKLGRAEKCGSLMIQRPAERECAEFPPVVSLPSCGRTLCQPSTLSASPSSAPSLILPPHAFVGSRVHARKKRNAREIEEGVLKHTVSWLTFSLSNSAIESCNQPTKVLEVNRSLTFSSCKD